MPDRASLGFVLQVRAAFAFIRDFGFIEADAQPTFVSYRNGSIGWNIFHGRQSYEIGAEAVRSGHIYPLSAIISLTDAEAGRVYCSFAARETAAVALGVQQMAELVQRFGRPILEGDMAVFVQLDDYIVAWRENYALEVLASQTRPKAAETFRAGNYEAAARLYRSIEPVLSPAEREKLSIAERRITK